MDLLTLSPVHLLEFPLQCLSRNLLLGETRKAVVVVVVGGGGGGGGGGRCVKVGRG